jgi:hypothetical protein
MFGLKALRLALPLALLVVAADLGWAAWSFAQRWTTNGAQYVAATNIYFGVALAVAGTSSSCIASSDSRSAEGIHALLGRSRA